MRRNRSGHRVQKTKTGIGLTDHRLFDILSLYTYMCPVSNLV